MANEKRLIDANKLFDDVENSKYDNPHTNGRVRINHIQEHDHFMKMIFDAPTVEAVEVVHGHKVARNRCRGIAYAMECPICHSKIPSNKPFQENVEYCSVCGKKLDDTFQNYCPSCGAKMDGDGNG